MEKTALEALVGRVADEFTARLDCGEHPDIEEYAQLYPGAAALLRGILPTLEALHPPLNLSPPLGGDKEGGSELNGDSASAPDLLKTRLGDFRIIREIGRGGMGIVYEAEQISLMRPVALKVLPFAAALDEKRLQRFQHEAQTAAHLHHTNIVPVFAVGCERAVHFYAMQYIAGQSLAAVIRELRQCAGRESPQEGAPSEAISEVSRSVVSGKCATGGTEVTPVPSALMGPPGETPPQWQDTLTKEDWGKGPLFFRTIARLGIQAAEALEYAHNKGVVHRDIKPANLLVDVCGDLWVTDFGMAQFRNNAELTQSGDLLGTIRYMSPEQALGKRDLVDNRTDIYSLGVSLYEVSTLETAFKGEDREELLRQITSEEPAQPQSLNQSIPRELETIILKAIAKTPDERYDSAKALADDLRRFLEDKPILAKRPSLLERLAKWSRRHKAVVRALGGGLIIALITLAVSTAMVWQGKRRTEAAYLAEAKARQRARQAADDMYTQFAEKWLAAEPQMEEMQREFLLKALRFYEEEVEEKGSRLRSQRALAQKRVADIHFKLGNDAAAASAYEGAIALLQELADEFPGERDYRLDLARSHAARGLVAMETGRNATAEQAERQAVLLAEQLVSDFSRDASCRVALIVFRVNLGVVLAKLARLEEAEASYRQALPVAEELVREFPEGPIYQSRLAGILHRWADLALVLGHASESERLYRRTLVVLDKLASDHPADLAYRSSWAGISRRLSDLLLEDGNLVEAEKALSRSVEVLEEVMKRYPKTIGHREEGASAWQSLGRLHQAAERTHQAERAFRRSIMLYEELLTQRPTRGSYSAHLAWLLADCPVERLRDPARAAKLAKKALELEPHSSSEIWVTLGLAHYRQGQWRPAIAALETGLGKHPPDTGRALFCLAMSCARFGDQVQARRYYEQAIKWTDGNQPRNPDLARWRAEAAGVLNFPDALRRK